MPLTSSSSPSSSCTRSGTEALQYRSSGLDPGFHERRASIEVIGRMRGLFLAPASFSAIFLGCFSFRPTTLSLDLTFFLFSSRLLSLALFSTPSLLSLSLSPQRDVPVPVALSVVRVQQQQRQQRRRRKRKRSRPRLLPSDAAAAATAAAVFPCSSPSRPSSASSSSSRRSSPDNLLDQPRGLRRAFAGPD